MPGDLHAGILQTLLIHLIEKSQKNKAEAWDRAPDATPMISGNKNWQKILTNQTIKKNKE